MVRMLAEEIIALIGGAMIEVANNPLNELAQSHTTQPPPATPTTSSDIMRYYGFTPFPHSAYTPTEEELERVVALSQQLHDYARTLSSLANTHRKINRLPQELMVKIFQEVRDIEGWGWLRLLLVCREWRAAGLSDSTLWSDITLQSKKLDVKLDFLQLCLARSKNAALSVAFRGNSAFSRFDKLEPHLYRLRELQLRGVYHLRSFLDKTTCEFPTLTTLIAGESGSGISVPDHAIVFNSTQFPKLQFLTIKGVVVDATSSALPQLVRLRLQELQINERSLAFLISRCTSLQHLDLEDISFSSRSSTSSMIEYASDTGGSYKLSNLKALSISAPHFRGLYRHLSLFLHRVQIPSGTYRICIVNGARGKCRHSTDIDDYQLRQERKGMKALLHTLVLPNFSPGSEPVIVNIYLRDSPAQARLAVMRGTSIVARLQHDLRSTWKEPNPRWGDSDLDELGRMLQGFPATQLNIRYVDRRTCQDEGGWRAFLVNFPDLQRLSICAPAPVAFTSDTTGVDRVLDALLRRSSEEHAGSEGAFVCTKLQELVIRNFMVDRDRFDADLSRMLESREAAGVALQQVKIDGCLFKEPPFLEK